MSANKYTTSVLLFVAIIVVVNLLAEQFYLRLDLTEDKQYTLSQATKDVLSDLQEPITVKAYFSKDVPQFLERVLTAIPAKGPPRAVASVGAT